MPSNTLPRFLLEKAVQNVAGHFVYGGQAAIKLICDIYNINNFNTLRLTLEMYLISIGFDRNPLELIDS